MKPVHERLIEAREKAAMENKGKVAAIPREEAAARFAKIREEMLKEQKERKDDGPAVLTKALVPGR